MRSLWTFAIVGFGFTFLLPREAAAQAAEVRILSSNGIRAAMEELLPQCERAIGYPIAIQFGSSPALQQMIDSGQAFDVAILTPALIDDLTKQGKIAADTRSNIARTGIGIAVRAGAPKPNINTSAALKQVLLNAKSITYARDGPSRPSIERMYESLGIATDVKGKIILQQVSGRPQISVAQGDAEIGIGLISEILPAPGIEFLGPLPAQFQSYIVLTAGVGAHTHNVEAAKALIRYLSGPDVVPALKAKGMEPR